MKRTRRSFTAEFKADAVALVQQQGYTVAQACQALDIGETALRRWVTQVEAETAGRTPTGKAITPEQQRIQSLERQVKRLEMEKAILKKRRRCWRRTSCPLCADPTVRRELPRFRVVCGSGDPTQ